MHLDICAKFGKDMLGNGDIVSRKRNFHTYYMDTKLVATLSNIV